MQVKQINYYWAQQAAAAVDIVGIDYDDQTVEFTVLSLARILYTMDHGISTTRAAAGHYALQVLPLRWERIIREALRIRQLTPQPALYSSTGQRAEETQAFARYMSDYCNKQHQMSLVDR